MIKLPEEAYAIVEGRHSDPFHYLGPHKEADKTIVRAFLPGASNVDAIDAHGAATSLEQLHEAGLFVGALANGSTSYQLRAQDTTLHQGKRLASSHSWAHLICVSGRETIG